MDKPQKISIGFHGGHALAARLSAAELAKLQSSLGKVGGWLELDSEDGKLIVDLTRIDYLLIDHEEHKIGF